MVATNAETPSSSGTPAATAAPNAISRISSVPPIENCMGLRLVGALGGAERLLPPTHRRTPRRAAAGAPSGPRRRRRAAPRPTSRSSRPSAAVSYLPGSVKFTTTERPSFETVSARWLASSGLSMSRDAVDLPEATDDVLHGGGHFRIAGLDRALALDEDALADGLGEAGVGDDHVAALGLAVAHRRRLEVLLADLAADHGGEDDEEDPADDGGLAVGGTPSAGACREVARLHGAPWRGLRVGTGQTPSGPARLPGGLQASGFRKRRVRRWCHLS